MEPPIWRRIEKAFDIPIGQLEAVIAYTGLPWSSVVIYNGSDTWCKAIKGRRLMEPDAIIESKRFESLLKVPPKGLVRNGTDYGGSRGKVLLVPAELVNR